MQGVEVLNTIHSYASIIHPGWAISFGMISIIIFVISIFYINNWEICKAIVASALAISCVALILAMCSHIKSDEIIDTQYQVTISDEVSMTEFGEKYEVIEQKGKIFTIREKE